MSDLRNLQPDDFVCISGRGTAAMIHRHERVLRVTKTLLVTKNANGVESGRFRLESGLSVPYDSYGGAYANLTCERPKQVRNAG